MATSAASVAKESMNTSTRISYSEAVRNTNSPDSELKSDLEELLAPRVFEENYKHKLLLENMRQGDKWERDLERVHGFTEAEACECFSRAGKYLHCDEFPEDAVNPKLFPHAKEGWILLKEARRLAKKYPKELMELDSRAAIEGKLFGEF